MNEHNISTVTMLRGQGHRAWRRERSGGENGHEGNEFPLKRKKRRSSCATTTILKAQIHKKAGLPMIRAAKVRGGEVGRSFPNDN